MMMDSLNGLNVSEDFKKNLCNTEAVEWMKKKINMCENYTNGGTPSRNEQ
jgi:hypothetical protein